MTDSLNPQSSVLNPAALITGGGGDLAKVIRAELESLGFAVQAPGKSVMDVRDAASIHDFMGQLSRLDLLVCNAGILRDKALTQMSQADFDDVLDVSLTGAFRVARSALKTMSEQGSGHIVFIGSNSARSGPIGQTNYAAAKAGLIGLTHSLARECGVRNIRVNCVLPGLLETKMTAHFDAERLARFRQAHTLGRFNTCAEVARFIGFLDRSMPHTSGQVFQLDSRVSRWT